MKIIPPYPDYRYFRSIMPTNLLHRYLIDLSILVYKDKEDIAELLESEYWVVDWHFISRDETQVLVVKFNNALLIAFRGTETFNVQDWFVDLDCSSVYGVHKGFREAFLLVEQELGSLIKKQRIDYVYFTGHSLGGALATVAGYFLNHTGVVTFGAPMVFTAEAEPMIDLVRYVHGEDIVPCLPPIGYKHIGELRLLKQVKKPWINLLTPRAIFDHVPTNYGERLWDST